MKDKIVQGAGACPFLQGIVAAIPGVGAGNGGRGCLAANRTSYH